MSRVNPRKPTSASEGNGTTSARSVYQHQTASPAAHEAHAAAIRPQVMRIRRSVQRRACQPTTAVAVSAARPWATSETSAATFAGSSARQSTHRQRRRDGRRDRGTRRCRGVLSHGSCLGRSGCSCTGHRRDGRAAAPPGRVSVGAFQDSGARRAAGAIGSGARECDRAAARGGGGPAVIEDVVARWHRYMGGDLPGGLDELLADDVVFYSPVVFTPQRGKEITTRTSRRRPPRWPATRPEAFRYTKQVLAGDTAVLEFETTLDGQVRQRRRHHPLRRRRADRRVPRDDAPPAGHPRRARGDGPATHRGGVTAVPSLGRVRRRPRVPFSPWRSGGSTTSSSGRGAPGSRSSELLPARPRRPAAARRRHQPRRLRRPRDALGVARPAAAG